MRVENRRRMRIFLFLFLLIAASFVLACSDDSANNPLNLDSCDLLQSAEALMERIDECNDHLILSTSEIVNNLIGDWALSGVLTGYGTFKPTSECLILSIDNESLVLKNLETGEESSSNWELTSYEVNGNPVRYLDPEDEALRWSVGMQFFSANIMYGAGLADDTEVFVYEK